jgi:cysteinyl-tRNA synthetase
MLKLHNTLSKKKETFEPLREKTVGLYTCGPTVYWFAHVGNLRSYIFEDILKRVLEYDGYKVRHVMNITDVGHLTSDADTGEDKIEKGAAREGKTAWDIAEFYTKAFQKDLGLLNIEPPTVLIKATDTIKEQIDLIKILEDKGFTYKLQDGIYFDTSKISDYGKLASKKKRSQKAGARVEIVEGKKNITDFALWKFSYPNGRSFDAAQDDSASRRQMEWDSPWGKGFPGWHTECVAMSSKYLGTPFDIHCGGIDHIPIHHPNEMAQAQAAFGNNLANYWLHNEFLTFEGGKMAKSEGNVITLSGLMEKGLNPLSFRYFCLNGNYGKKMDFSIEAVKAAQNALQNLKLTQTDILEKNHAEINKARQEAEKFLQKAEKKFSTAINDDMNTPKALSVLHEVVDYEQKMDEQKLADSDTVNIFKEKIAKFDKVFGLGLNNIRVIHNYKFSSKEGTVFGGSGDIPQEIKVLIGEREKARQEKNWQKSDQLRDKLKTLGYEVKDRSDGQEIKKL